MISARYRRLRLLISGKNRRHLRRISVRTARYRPAVSAADGRLRRQAYVLTVPCRPADSGLREDRPAPPHLRRERRHHHARRAPRYDCPFGYHHRQADCAYYHDDRGYYHPHRPAARY